MPADAPEMAAEPPAAPSEGEWLREPRRRLTGDPVALDPAKRTIPFGFRQDVEQPSREITNCTTMTTGTTWVGFQVVPASPR